MDKMDVLKKLKALSEDVRGNDNERQSAETRLNELMLKFNITIEDLEENIPKRREIYFDGIYENRLVYQIIYKLFKDRPVMEYTRKSNDHKRHHCLADLTDAEYIEFEFLFDVYKVDLKKHLDMFYTAFIQKNNIFPRLTDEEREALKQRIKEEPSRAEQMRIAMMSQGIQESEIRRRLGNGNV